VPILNSNLAESSNCKIVKKTLKFRRLSCQDKILKYYPPLRKLRKISLDRDALLFNSNIELSMRDVRKVIKTVLTILLNVLIWKEDDYGHTK
jgi:hypothetical protein